MGLDVKASKLDSPQEAGALPTYWTLRPEQRRQHSASRPCTPRKLSAVLRQALETRRCCLSQLVLLFSRKSHALSATFLSVQGVTMPLNHLVSCSVPLASGPNIVPGAFDAPAEDAR